MISKQNTTARKEGRKQAVLVCFVEKGVVCVCMYYCSKEGSGFEFF